MAHMVLCAFVGGPLDGQTIEVNDQKNTVEYDRDGKPLVISPIEQDSPVQNTTMRRHVYKREDATSFIYGGYY